ncbi:hypothetical protein AZE42_11487 [Rhizopogon vesiculosus]|uniref:Uncharacterized protein n=1 Tax=Rhizopogon vesiculosus TaxID=180088 RepID=A0A1J8Q6E0_9AGAM|nr:hypothetical protein AZE42_11487 [Rhizopogon vesiculosus]
MVHYVQIALKKLGELLISGMRYCK